MKRKMQSVEKHKFSERIFAYYDNLLRYKPHINTLASEAYIAFAINKTGKWLKEKTDEKFMNWLHPQEKKWLISEESSNTERRREKLEETRQQKEAEAARKLQKQEEITNEIIFYSLWQSTDQVDRVLDTTETNKENIKALKAQLRFRKEILKQHPDNPAIYRFSKKNNGKTVALSVEEMSENVKALVGHALNISTTPSPEMQLLVGRRVRHRFTANTTGTERWYTGKVISQVPGYPEWFNISYSDDDAVYSYNLMEDYKAKDLEIII